MYADYLFCTIIGLIILVGTIYKFKTVKIICKHPELSDKKVKYLTEMMTKQYKRFF